MRIRWSAAVTLALATLTSSLAYGQRNTERGAAIGGVAGALAGAAIGKHNRETAAGALIGGAVGLVTGAAIGNARDGQIERMRVEEQMRWQAASRSISIQDVISMSQSGVADGVIINQIQQYGVQRRLEVSDVIAMHQQGVSESVISMMQRAPLGAAPRYRAPVVRPAPVIVEEHYYEPPVYYARPTYYHHYYHHHPRPVSGTYFYYGF